MTYGYAHYSRIKKLLDKFNVCFKSHAEYEDFMRELSVILEI